MELKKALQEIAALDRRIDQEPDAPELYMERGKLYYGIGEMDSALNDFVRVRELDPKDREAAEYVGMISEIFEFRYKDIYNP